MDIVQFAFWVLQHREPAHQAAGSQRVGYMVQTGLGPTVHAPCPTMLLPVALRPLYLSAPHRQPAWAHKATSPRPNDGSCYQSIPVCHQALHAGAAHCRTNAVSAPAPIAAATARHASAAHCVSCSERHRGCAAAGKQFNGRTSGSERGRRDHRTSWARRGGGQPPAGCGHTAAGPP